MRPIDSYSVLTSHSRDQDKVASHKTKDLGSVSQRLCSVNNKTQTAMINIICEFSHFYKLDVSYAVQDIVSKVILSDRQKKDETIYSKITRGLEM